VRADVPGGANDRQRRLHERVTALDAFADTRMRLVPDRLSLSGVAADSPSGRALRGAVVDAKRWATTADVDLDPYLPVTDESSMVTDHSRQVLTFPSVTLVEYDDDGAVDHVAPHVADDRVVAVEHRVEDLAVDAEGHEPMVVQS
jgi:hypothetical protein